MSLQALQLSVELGLIYSLLALGLMISFRILDVADLTVDSSFTLGAAVSAVFAVGEGSIFGIPFASHPVLALVLATLAGAAAGLVTGLLQTKLGVQPILAGILTMTGLYSINLHVMGRSNLAVPADATVFEGIKALLGEEYGELILLLLIAAVLLAVVTLFFKTQLGMSIRATGDNEDMVRSSSINADFTKLVGLAIANALVALSGGLLAQYQGFADISMGIGMVIIGLASIIIGEVILGKKTVFRRALAAIVGAVIYRIIIALAMRINMNQNDLKLISAIIVTVAVAYPTVKHYVARKLKRKGKRAC